MSEALRIATEAVAAANAALARLAAVEDVDTRTVLLNTAGKLLRYREVAELLAIDESTAREYGARAEWPEVRISDGIVRVRLSDLIDYQRRKTCIRGKPIAA